MRLWSFLNECPIVALSPENIKKTLHSLITRPELRQELGGAGRKYFEKCHDLDSSPYLFEKCLDSLYKNKHSLKNLYHPLLGDNFNRSSKIKFSLVYNGIPE